jgi:AcrR family transcriptional regulator
VVIFVPYGKHMTLIWPGQGDIVLIGMKSVSKPDSAAVNDAAKIAAESTDAACKRPRGRPRAFDCERALDAAVQLFWKHGYEGTSLDDLTDAMGINRPSLYAAFGNKETLFRKALDRYVSTSGKTMCDALSATTAREAVERMLRNAASGCVSGPGGCLLVQGALAGSDESEPIRRELAARRAGTEQALRVRFDRSILEGDLPKGTDATALARYATTLLHGLAVQSGSGATKNQLMAVVDVAMAAFPQAKAKRKSNRK